ncbi:MAG TPA: hypothetical protein VNQ90_07215 [Chthoniobacteraceae bacterium]|nr:hypothetical protein [Chthoniobacteraceae bacterium]
MVQLLAAMAIAVVLAALLYPALRRSSENAATGKCAGNLRSISVALAAHAADHDGYLPKLANTPGHNSGWALQLAPYLGIDLRVRNQKTVFFCPADKIFIRLPAQLQTALKNSNGGRSSYKPNIHLIDLPAGERSALGGISRGSARLSQISEPAATLLVAETCRYSNWLVSPSGVTYKTGLTFSYIRPPGEDDGGNPTRDGGYHPGGAKGVSNWLFADGHIERLTFEQTVPPGAPLNLWEREKR